MQYHRFSNGGFVIHFTFCGYRVSAWYAADGSLLDIENRNPRGRLCGVGEAVRQHAVSLGRVYQGA